MKREGDGWQIETTRGEFWAKNVVWNGVLPAPFRARKTDFQGARWGAFKVYAAISRAAIPGDFPPHAQILREFAPRFPFLTPGAGEDVFLSLSLENDEASAPQNFATLNLSTHVRLRDWHGLSPLEYRAKKKLWREKLLQIARVALPDLENHTLFALAGTPSTWQKYTLREGGFVGGPPLSRRNANLRAASIRTRFPNLFQVGDETFPGQGTVACALSGWNAWHEIDRL